MQPILDRVYIQPRKGEQTTSEGGIVLLEDKTLNEGTVLATGPGKAGEPMQIEVGDEVIWLKRMPSVPFEGNVILHQADIEGITREAGVPDTGND